MCKFEDSGARKTSVAEGNLDVVNAKLGTPFANAVNKFLFVHTNKNKTAGPFLTRLLDLIICLLSRLSNPCRPCRPCRRRASEEFFPFQESPSRALRW